MKQKISFSNPCCGVYCIKQLSTRKVYIGSSSNIYNRRKTHFSFLKNGKHKNHVLQEQFNLYGESDFVIDLIESVDKSLLKEKELEYIEKYNSFKDGFNIMGLGKLKGDKENFRFNKNSLGNQCKKVEIIFPSRCKKEFDSYTEAAEYLDTNRWLIARAVKNGKSRKFKNYEFRKIN